MHIDSRPVNRQAPKRNLLKNPQGHSEFEVQAHIYCELRKMGWEVRGELTTYAGKARFDLVVFDGGGRFPIRIIEVKCRPRSAKPGTRSGDQIGDYYDHFGIPVDLVCGMKDAVSYLRRVADGLYGSVHGEHRSGGAAAGEPDGAVKHRTRAADGAGGTSGEGRQADDHPILPRHAPAPAVDAELPVLAGPAVRVGFPGVVGGR
jgi:hypothetical protein